MKHRIIVIASALAALVHCSGQSSAGSGTEGPDASGSSSGGSSGGNSSGGTSSGGTSSGGTSSGGTSSGGSSNGGPDSGGDGACPRPADAAPRATTPPQHRAQATACAPSASHTACGVTDGGGQSCTTDADCAQDGGTFSPYSHCLHGQCGLDPCLADSDCASTEVCSCSSAYYGGNSCYHPNVCVPADCHVDSDCGPGGFCSPTAGYCGVVQGFYCHKASDACFDPAVDCACAGPANGACVYTPTTGAWVCGSAICAG